MVPAIDLTGRRFGKLTILQRHGSTVQGLALWRCRCDCGTEFNRSGSEIRVAGEKARCRTCGYDSMVSNRTIHGETGTYLHTAWMNARRRVTDKSHPRFDDWGGRGITMFVEWMGSYGEFREYVLNTLGPRPSEDHTLDRADNDKGYEPGNLRWATHSEQQLNKRPYGSGVVADNSYPKKRRGRPPKKSKKQNIVGFTANWPVEKPKL